MPADLVTQLKLSKIMGISRITVRRMIDKGVFQLDSNKKLSVKACTDAYAAYQASLEHPSKPVAKIPEKDTKKAENALKDVETASDSDDFAASLAEWKSELESDPIGVLNKAKAYLTMMQAKDAKLKADETEGRLFSIERINADAEKVGLAIASKLRTVPQRVSAMCEGRTARDIEAIVTDEINNALEELQKLFVKG